jgi:hypothetical protein
VVKKNTGGKWEVTPWTSPNFDHPPLADIEYVDPAAKSKRLGAVVYVGKSSDQSWAQHGGLNQTPAGVSKSLVKRGMMATHEVYLGI